MLHLSWRVTMADRHSSSTSASAAARVVREATLPTLASARSLLAQVRLEQPHMGACIRIPGQGRPVGLGLFKASAGLAPDVAVLQVILDGLGSTSYQLCAHKHL